MAVYKAAAQQFVTTMSGTPTRLKIFSFSASATADQNTFLDLENAGDVATANSKLNTIYNNPGGSTNWDAGMKLAAGAGVDVVVFITDGNPTSRDSTTSGANSDGGGTVDLLDLTFGIASANKVKTQGKSAVLGTGASILALGVGTGVTAGNLAAVSGPVAGVDYSTSSTSGLDTMLQQLANKLCGARIHVRKLTNDGDVAVAKSGWTFTAGKPAGSPVTFTPGAITTTGLPADDVIKVDKVPAAGGSVTLAETAQANYSFASSQCAKNNFPDALSGGSATTTIAAVQRNDDWYCTFRNARQTGTIKIVKNLSPASDAGRFDLNVDGGAAEASDVGDGGSTGAVTVNTGTSHAISEVAHAGTSLTDYTSSYVCKVGQTTVASGDTTSASGITVAKDDAVVCTFTNTRKTGTIEIRKLVVPAADAGRFDLNVDGGAAEATTVGDGGTTGAVSVNTGPGHSAAETAADGTSLGSYVSTYSCTDGDTTVASGSGASVSAIAVAYRQAIVCTFTNTRKATVTIHEVTIPHDATTSFGFHTTLPGAGTLSLVDGGSQTREAPPGTFTVSQDDPRPDGYKLTGLVCTESGAPDSTVPAAADIAGNRTATIAAQAGEHIDCTFTDKPVLPSTLVVKAGTEYAYHGDTLSYTFTVTNNGNSPLHQVTVTDDRCPNVSAAPVSKTNDNGDTALDPLGADGTNPEAWVFSCTMALAGHTATEANPVVNTATVHALDEYDRPVTAHDEHTTLILHPSVAIDKTGPATAVAGDAVVYALVITNTGDEAFAAPLVVVTDARCEAPPALVSTTNDATPASFDPGDKWGYLCRVQTQLGETLVHNTGVVDGTDPHGHHVSAQDSADTQLTQPAGSVLPEIITPGTGKLRGQTGCITSSRAAATVTGKNIASVRFTLDGRTVSTLRKADKKGRYILKVAPGKLSYGVHRVTARVTFTRASGTRAKTLKLALTRCRPAVIKPKFTG